MKIWTTWLFWLEQDSVIMCSDWWTSCLVADVGERISRITAAGLTARRSVQVPVSVLTLITEDANHACPAGTLSSPPITEAGTPQRTLSHLCPPPVTGALWEINQKYTKYMNTWNPGMQAEPLRFCRCPSPTIAAVIIIYMIVIILIFTFAVLLQGIAIVTRFAVLAAWSHCVVETVQTLSRHAVTGVSVIRVNVVVAGTLLTADARHCQVTIETRTASVAVWTWESWSVLISIGTFSLCSRLK